MKNLNITLLSTLLLLLLTQYNYATTYSNANTMGTKNWNVIETKHTGAVVKNIYDKNKKSRVIFLKNNKDKSSYLLGAKYGGNIWNNKDEKYLSWDMNFKMQYKIIVYILTKKGQRYLYYSSSNQEGIQRKKYIRINLGTKTKVGEWVKISRDIEADLKKYEPSNQLIAVNGMHIYGSGKINNIQLSKKESTKKSNFSLTKEPAITFIAPDTVAIAWSLNHKSTGQIEYGESINYGTKSKKENSFIYSSHSQKLKHIKKDTIYYYRIHSTDGNGKKIVSQNHTFKIQSNNTSSTRLAIKWIKEETIAYKTFANYGGNYKMVSDKNNNLYRFQWNTYVYGGKKKFDTFVNKYDNNLKSISKRRFSHEMRGVISDKRENSYYYGKDGYRSFYVSQLEKFTNTNNLIWKSYVYSNKNKKSEGIIYTLGAIDKHDNIYLIEDTGLKNYKLVKFNTNGELLWKKDIGTKVKQIKVDKRANIYLLNDQLSKYNSKGEKLFTIKGSFKDIALDKHNKIYLLSSTNIQQYSHRGKILTYTVQGAYNSIVLNTQDELYAMNRDSITKFNPQGKKLTQLPINQVSIKIAKLGIGQFSYMLINKNDEVYAVIDHLKEYKSCEKITPILIENFKALSVAYPSKCQNNLQSKNKNLDERINIETELIVKLQ